MLFFILALQPDRRPHWYSQWHETPPQNDPEMEEIADEIRGLCMREGRQYICLWGFHLDEPLLSDARRLHARFQEKFRRVCLTHFAAGYAFGHSRVEQQTDTVATEEAELIAADPTMRTLLLMARTLGLASGREDATEA